MSRPERDILSDFADPASPSDQMLRALLEDFVQVRTPPDLKAQIIAKLAISDDANDISRRSEQDAAVQSAHKDIRDGYGVIVPPPVALTKSDDRELSVWIRAGAIAVAALAAAVMAAVFIPDLMNGSNSNSSQVKLAQPTVRSEPLQDGPVLASEPSQRDDDSRIKISEPNRATSSERVEATVATSDKVPSQSVPKAQASSLVSNARNDFEIVRVIDDQMSYLWQRVGVKPASEVPMETWLDRIAIAVLGRQATAAEKEAFRSNKSENKASEYVDGLVLSSEFAKVWSSRLAEHYLGKRIRGTRDIVSAETGFLDWLEQSVAKRTAIGELERQLVVGASDVADSLGTRNDAASYWIAETMERAGAVQREAIEPGSLITKREPRDESLIGLSRQLMRLSGNPSMVCSQCHTEDAGGSDLRGLIAKVKSKNAEGSNAFWSVPASLAGFRLSYQNADRTLRVEPVKSYFFEDADGKMKLANAGVPSLRKNAKGSDKLADWIRESSEPRRALVDMVWNQMFQQPLVPPTGLSDEEGQAERGDLRDMLADQMQVRQADLATLVRWVVLSKAMRLEGVKTDAPWYIDSTITKIAATQKQLRILAGYSRVESMKSESGKLSVGKVASWIDQKRSFQTEALAQPSETAGVSKGQKQRKVEYSEDQVRYLISVDEPYSQIKAIADRLAKSSMAWPTLVEHAYLATDARFPNRAEREEATKLLDTTGNDRMKTLVMIVNARLGSW